MLLEWEFSAKEKTCLEKLDIPQALVEQAKAEGIAIKNGTSTPIEITNKDSHSGWNLEDDSGCLMCKGNANLIIQGKRIIKLAQKKRGCTEQTIQKYNTHYCRC